MVWKPLTLCESDVAEGRDAGSSRPVLFAHRFYLGEVERAALGGLTVSGSSTANF